MTRVLAVAFAILLSIGARALTEDMPLPEATLAAAMKQADCDEPANAESLIETYDLGHGAKLIEWRCWRAAYQAGSIFYLLDSTKPANSRLLRFQARNSKGFRDVFTLTSPEFFAKTKTLTSFHKGRGVGDCGEIGEWKWTGTAFRLTGYWIKAACDGEPFEDDRKWRVYPSPR